MDITSATAKVKLFCALTPAGLSFERYSADSAWSKETNTVIESRMGVDGKISFGYTPSVKTVNFVFQPDSPTLERLAYIIQTQNTTMLPIVWQVLIDLGSIERAFYMVNACITTGDILPAGGRVLEPVTISLSYESIESAKK